VQVQTAVHTMLQFAEVFYQQHPAEVVICLFTGKCGSGHSNAASTICTARAYASCSAAEHKTQQAVLQVLGSAAKYNPWSFCIILHLSRLLHLLEGCMSRWHYQQQARHKQQA
jgi:hypothetical protein